MKTEVSRRNRIKCFASTLRRKNLKTSQSQVIIGFVFEENIGHGNHVITDYRDVIVFAIKALFSKCFPSIRKRKAGVSNSVKELF